METISRFTPQDRKRIQQLYGQTKQPLQLPRTRRSTGLLRRSTADILLVGILLVSLGCVVLGLWLRLHRP